MKKCLFLILSLCFATQVFAESHDEKELSYLSYCYGVYEVVKSPEEVNKIKETILDKDNYASLTENEFYKKGKESANSLSKTEQTKCLMVSYGFLAVQEAISATVSSESMLQKDLPYCWGYMDAASNGHFLLTLCSAFGQHVSSQTNEQSRLDECRKEAVKNSSSFAEGNKDGAIADPMQVMACANTFSNEMNKDIESFKKAVISIWPEASNM